MGLIRMRSIERLPPMPRSELLTIHLLVIALNLAGCASSHGPRANSPTSGLELTMFVRDSTSAEAFYRVWRDGTLGFGGGMDARLERTSWTGPMSAEEIRALHRLLEVHNWYSANPVSTHAPKDQLYRITVHAPQARKRFRVKGESPDVQPIRKLLEHASLRRLEGELQRLPEPSAKRQPAPESTTTQPE
jgi:hypothetical protein